MTNVADRDELHFQSISLAAMLVLNKLRVKAQLGTTEHEIPGAEDGDGSHEKEKMNAQDNRKMLDHMGSVSVEGLVKRG